MKKKLILIFVDIILVVLSYISAFILRFEFESALGYTHFIKTSLPITTIVVILVFIRMGMYKAVWRYASMDSFITTVKAVTIGVLISVVIIFFFEIYRIPRSIFIIYWFILLAGVGCVRFSTRFYRYYFAHTQKKGSRVLIYGAGSAGQMIAKEMKYDRSLGYNPVCFIDDDPNKIGKRLHGIKVIGNIKSIIDLNMLFGLRLYK